MPVQKKKIDSRDLTGDKGIALIHTIVSDMGYIWNSTGLEAGIDGYIEIRDPVSGEMTNLVIQVQSKATERSFEAETADGFDYYCEERDLDYWISGNAPVILVRSRPSTKEAYWVSIKEYFRDLPLHATRKIHFDKTKNKLDASARDAILAIAKLKDSGIYLSPLPKQERLHSNLLKVESFGNRLYLAETPYRSRYAVWNKFDTINIEAGSEWILKNQRILSFQPLDESPWRDICDSNTVESFDTTEWADSDEPSVLRDFVQLLRVTLAEKLWPAVEYKKGGYYFFAPTSDLSPRKIQYRSIEQKTHRTVFQGYPKKDRSTEMSYFRHSAFFGDFKRYDGVWYLEITPTYRYTWDGYDSYWNDEALLTRIKQMERNPAVVGQVVMWADYLKEKEDLFTRAYPFLTFGSLLTFDLNAGINDKVWLPNEENDESEIINSPLNQSPLFELPNEN